MTTKMLPPWQPETREPPQPSWRATLDFSQPKQPWVCICPICHDEVGRGHVGPKAEEGLIAHLAGEHDLPVKNAKDLVSHAIAQEQ